MNINTRSLLYVVLFCGYLLNTTSSHAMKKIWTMKKEVTPLAFGGEKYIALAKTHEGEKYLEIYSIPKRKKINIWKTKDRILELKFSECNQYAVCSHSREGNFSLCFLSFDSKKKKFATPKTFFTMPKTHPLITPSIAWQPDTSSIAMAHEDTIRLMDLKLQKITHTIELKIHIADSITCLSFDKCGNNIICGTKNGTVITYNLKTDQQKRIYSYTNKYFNYNDSHSLDNHKSIKKIWLSKKEDAIFVCRKKDKDLFDAIHPMDNIQLLDKIDLINKTITNVSTGHYAYSDFSPNTKFLAVTELNPNPRGMKRTFENCKCKIIDTRTKQTVHEKPGYTERLTFNKKGTLFTTFCPKEKKLCIFKKKQDLDMDEKERMLFLSQEEWPNQIFTINILSTNNPIKIPGKMFLL